MHIKIKHDIYMYKQRKRWSGLRWGKTEFHQVWKSWIAERPPRPRTDSAHLMERLAPSVKGEMRCLSVDRHSRCFLNSNSY